MRSACGSVRRQLCVLACTAAVLALLGCTGGGSDPADTVIGDIINTARANTLGIRVVNDTLFNIETTIRVDGVIKELPPCTPLQRSCDYMLTTCPNKVELIQETRRDSDDVFMGGRNFEGSASFTFDKGDYDCGGTIIYQFSETEAQAMAM